MKNRILFAAGGAIFGVLLSAPVQDAFHISANVSLGACAVGGLVVGCFVAILSDVFTMKHEEPHEPADQWSRD